MSKTLDKRKSKAEPEDTDLWDITTVSKGFLESSPMFDEYLADTSLDPFSETAFVPQYEGVFAPYSEESEVPIYDGVFEEEEEPEEDPAEEEDGTPVSILSPPPTQGDEEDSLVARGDTLVDEDESLVLLKSELFGVSDEAWTRFVTSQKTADVGTVSLSNALGMFETMPRRLADLGFVEKLTRTKSPTGRVVWTARFIPPVTSDIFLTNPELQYKAFVASVKDYAEKLGKGDIHSDNSMSLSGKLAILHRCGPNGLNTWNNTKDRFVSTIQAFEKSKDIF